MNDLLLDEVTKEIKKYPFVLVGAFLLFRYALPTLHSWQQKRKAEQAKDEHEDVSKAGDARPVGGNKR